MDEKDMLLKTIEGLNASVASLSAINKKQADQNEKQQERIRELTAQVAWLNRQLFGRKAEKFPVYDPNMPDLFADEFAGLLQKAEEKRDEAVEKIEKESAEEKRQKRQNRKIMEDLPSVMEKNPWPVSTTSRVTSNATVLRVMKQPSRLTPVCTWSTVWYISAGILNRHLMKTGKWLSMGLRRYRKFIR